jgi:hypothetical protein
MMVFGIVVEGFADAAVYSKLIAKIRHDVQSVVPRPCGGKKFLKDKFVGYLKEFQWRWKADKALVIRDSDCRDSGLVEDQLERQLRASGFQPQFPIHFYATNCMVDTWLLADENAVNRVALQRGKRPSAQPVRDPLEGRTNTKTMFRSMLSQASLPADPAVYAEVAGEADMEVILRRCPYFQQFVERINAC